MYQISEGDIVFAKKLASKMYSRYGSAKIEREELVSLALLGLVEAAHRYQEGKGTAFRSFAYRRVTGQMLDYLREVLARKQGDEPRTADIEYDSSATTNVRAQAEIHEELGLQTRTVSKTTECSYLNDKTPEEACNIRLLFEKVERAIPFLTEIEQTIIRLHYFEGRLFCEVKRFLGGKSKSYVSTCHSRALEKLSACMAT